MCDALGTSDDNSASERDQNREDTRDGRSTLKYFPTSSYVEIHFMCYTDINRERTLKRVLETLRYSLFLWHVNLDQTPLSF